MVRGIAAAVVFAASAVAGSVNAQSWTRADLPFGAVYEVAAHPTLPAVSFASTSSGVYRTSDGGSHWQHMSDVDLSSFAFDPFRDAEICALPGYHTLATTAPGFCSTDLGLTWSPLPDGPLNYGGLHFLLFDRRVPDRMYADIGYGNNWILVSDDHGKSWSPTGYTAGHPNYHGWGFNDADWIYVTSWPHGSGVYWAQPWWRRRDGGASWEEVVGSGWPAVWTVAIDSSQRSTLYFASDDASPPGYGDPYTIHTSTDHGTTWDTRGQVSASDVLCLAADPVKNTTIYAAGASGSVSVSLDGGRSWTRIDQGQVHEAAAPNVNADSVHSITVGVDGTLYVATRDAVFVRKIPGRRHASRR